MLSDQCKALQCWKVRGQQAACLSYFWHALCRGCSCFSKLQAQVCDILPSTTAVFCYAIGSRKLSANEQFFCWCSNSSKFVTNNWNKTRRHLQPPTKFTPAQIKPQSFESKRNSFLLPGVDASHVYVRALALGCFYSHISTRIVRRALTASLDSCAEIKSAPSVA